MARILASMISSVLIKANLVLGWTWVLLGFGSGALIGLKFHQPEWLGGYASHKRRLYRLGHISFFGLGAINFLFAFTAFYCAPGPGLEAASTSFIVGTLMMPLTCLVFAHHERLHMVFALPVTALLCGAVLTLISLIHL
jgi:hypothetical protein